MVPALTNSVKSEGLVLVSQMLDSSSAIQHPPSLMNLVDGVLPRDGVLIFNETIDM